MQIKKEHNTKNKKNKNDIHNIGIMNDTILLLLN
jgi:hypothetical protein